MGRRLWVVTISAHFIFNNMDKQLTAIYPELLNMVRTLTKCHHTTEDLVNDVIVEFLKYPDVKKDQILEDGKLKEYLYIMCKTQYLSSNSKYHVQYRESQILQYNDEVDMDTLEAIETDEHQQDDLKKIIISMINICDDVERALIADRYIEGKTYKEIAKRHNLPLAVATNKIKNSINKIKLNIHGTL